MTLNLVSYIHVIPDISSHGVYKYSPATSAYFKLFSVMPKFRVAIMYVDA